MTNGSRTMLSWTSFGNRARLFKGDSRHLATREIPRMVKPLYTAQNPPVLAPRVAGGEQTAQTCAMGPGFVNYPDSFPSLAFLLWIYFRFARDPVRNC
jgi:hypothetical protein